MPKPEETAEEKLQRELDAARARITQLSQELDLTRARFAYSVRYNRPPPDPGFHPSNDPQAGLGWEYTNWGA